MRRPTTLVVAWAVSALLVSCSEEEPMIATPAEVVSGWLAALDGPEDPGVFVLDGQLAVLASLGRPEDGSRIIAEGLSDESAAAYWESLALGIEAIGGVAPSGLAVGEIREFAIDGVDHAFVTIEGPDGGTTVVVQSAVGRIDLIATTGPALVRPLTTLLRAVAPGLVDGPLLAQSLRVGLANPELDLPPQFYGETQDLIVLIDRP